MGEVKLRQPGYVAELIEVFNRAKKNDSGEIGGGGGCGGSSVVDGTSTSWSMPTTTDEPPNSRTTNSLSEVASSFSHDLPVLYSDYLQPSSSCQWSSPDGHSDTAEHCSIDAFTTMKQSTKCVCICNQKNCEYLKNKVESRSNSPEQFTQKNNHLKKVFTLLRERKTFHQSYEIPKHKTESKWWKRRRTFENSLFTLNRPSTPTPTIPVLQGNGDTVDFSISSPALRRNGKVKNKSKPEVIEMEQMEIRERDADLTTRITNHEETNGNATHTSDDREEFGVPQPPLEEVPRRNFKTVFVTCSQCCTSCIYRPSPVRIACLVLGTLLFLVGISYDFGVKHIVDRSLANCWQSLLDEYINFGNSFMTYNEILLSTEKNDREKKYVIFDEEAVVIRKMGDYWKKVADKDPYFVYIMEGMELSIQIHFLSLIDSVKGSQVKVKDVGPLYLKVTFSQNTGFIVEYISHKSKMTLLTPFQVYDMMKMLLESNDLPHFGFHMKDYYDTTPTALLNVVVDALKKFKISSAFLENLQTQTQLRIRRRRSKKGQLMGERGIFEDLIYSTFLSFPPDKTKIVNIPVSQIRKNLTLEFKKTEQAVGIPCWKFVYQEAVEQNLTKFVSGLKKWNSRRENKIMFAVPYKSEDTSTPDSISRRYPMVIDLGPAIKASLGETKLLGQIMNNYPVWVSTPHFQSDRDDKSEPLLESRIEGFSPSDSEHESVVHYHPVLGVPINASIAVQIGIRPPDKMMHGGQLVPVLWVRAQVEKIPSALWYMFWFITHLRLIVISVLTCCGVLLMAVAATCRCRNEPTAPPPTPV